MKIQDQLKIKQPEIYSKLNKKHKCKKRREMQQHLSFDFIDRLMRERTAVDETKFKL